MHRAKASGDAQRIKAAEQGDWAPFARLQTVLAAPYNEHAGYDDLAALERAGKLDLLLAGA